MATQINAPVGRGVSSTGRRAVNQPDDVEAIQKLLKQVGLRLSVSA